MIEYLAKLVKRQDLAEDEAAAAYEIIIRGDATPSQIAGFLVALRIKGETADEIAALASPSTATARLPRCAARPTCWSSSA